MTIRRVPLKHLAAVPITNGLGLPGEHDNPEWPRYIRTTDIAGPTSLRDDTFASQPPEIAKAALVQKGDILMTAAGATIGKSIRIVEDIDACYAGFLVRFRPSERVDGRFIAYWMQSADYWAQIEAGAVRSTIDNFSASKYRNLEAPCPSLDQQIAIADLLDRQTSRLEYAIALQRHQLSLLEEYKRSLITAEISASPNPNSTLREDLT